MVQEKETGYRLTVIRHRFTSTYLFEYSVSAQAPVTEGNLVIAVTEDGRDPLMLDCREINVHVV